MATQTVKLPGKSNFFETYGGPDAGRLIGVEGYMGDAGAGTVKLHNPFSPSSFIEIPRDAIRRAKTKVDDEGFETSVLHLPMRTKLNLAGVIDLSLAEVVLHSAAFSQGGCSCGKEEASAGTAARQIGPGGGGGIDLCSFCFWTVEACKFGAGSNPVRWIWCYIDAIICFIQCKGRTGPTFPIP